MAQNKTATSFTVPLTPLIDPSTGQTSFPWIKWFQGVQQSISNTPQVNSATGVPAGSAFEGNFYFDTSVSPAHGYVWHNGAWVQFS